MEVGEVVQHHVEAEHNTEMYIITVITQVNIVQHQVKVKVVILIAVVVQHI